MPSSKIFEILQKWILLEESVKSLKNDGVQKEGS
jgi:hypothetical protein